MYLVRKPRARGRMIQPTESEISQRLQQARSATSTDGYAQGGTGASKCAAVLIPLLRQDGEWHLLYTRRTDQVESHKGQVSFPGGACDDGETTPEQTALREAQEEIGLDPGGVRLLGRLNSMLTITSYRHHADRGCDPVADRLSSRHKRKWRASSPCPSSGWQNAPTAGNSTCRDEARA